VRCLLRQEGCHRTSSRRTSQQKSPCKHLTVSCNHVLLRTTSLPRAGLYSIKCGLATRYFSTISQFANSILATRPCHIHTHTQSPPQPDTPSRQLQQVPEVSQLQQVPRNRIHRHESCTKSPRYYYSFTKSPATRYTVAPSPRSNSASPSPSLRPDTYATTAAINFSGLLLIIPYKLIVFHLIRFFQ
jgi:hypothetical protein